MGPNFAIKICDYTHFGAGNVYERMLFESHKHYCGFRSETRLLLRARVCVITIISHLLSDLL